MEPRMKLFSGDKQDASLVAPSNGVSRPRGHVMQLGEPKLGWYAVFVQMVHFELLASLELPGTQGEQLVAPNDEE